MKYIVTAFHDNAYKTSDVSRWSNPKPYDESLAVARILRSKQHATVRQRMIRFAPE
jgi:hypothetical protein